MDKESNKHSSLVVLYTLICIYLQVWGIVYLSTGFSRTSKKINNQLHTFFVNHNLLGVGETICCSTMKQSPFRKLSFGMAIISCLLILNSSCSVSHEVIIMSKPQTAAIYIDGEYQGIGYVRYVAPKGAQSIQVSCSTNGEIYDYKEVFLSKKQQYVNISEEEFMRYGAQPNSFKNK